MPEHLREQEKQQTDMTLWCHGPLSFLSAVQCMATAQLLGDDSELAPGDTVLIDLDDSAPRPSLDLIRRACSAKCDVVAVCLPESVQLAVPAIQAGAQHVALKPLRPDDLARHVEVLSPPKTSDLSKWRSTFAPDIIGEGRGLIEALEMATRAAEVDCPVLITGESGTGKELLAKALHRASPRGVAPCIPVNCPAIPKDLVESELFGHAKGAFTGATNARIGRFTAADGGTLFLDEIGEMDLNIQSKLLRALQDYEITPVGESRAQRVDVRVIAATNRNLETMSAAGQFREDLYYRLNVVQIHMPSLKQRQEDVPLLIEHFLHSISRQRNLVAPKLTERARRVLEEFHWPGNVRQLRNVIERLVILHRGQLVDVAQLPITQVSRPVDNNNDEEVFGELPIPQDGFDLRHALQRFEEAMIQKALAATGGNRNQAAKMLGLNRTTLVEKLRKNPVALE